MTDAPPVLLRRGREGGRWVNERPTPDEFASWFTTSMKLDPALKAEDYIGGVVLIPALDTRAKFVTGFTDKGLPIVEEREELSYIPYAKVETRIAYFWDLLDAHEDWLGVVERVTPPRMPIDFVHTEETVAEGLTESGQRIGRTERKLRTPGALTLLTHQLPDGFSIMSVPVGTGYSHFLCCTIRVTIVNKEGLKLRTGVGTKQVPLLMGRSQPYADPNSLMKAETGALGRALGTAGIFVIPGSGISSAEDMLEAAAQGTTVAEAAPDPITEPATPPAAPVRSGAEAAADEEARLSKRATELFKALSDEHPDRAETFGLWARSRKLNSLSDARGPILRGVVKKLERLTDEVTAAAEAATQKADTPEEVSDAPVGDEPSGPASPSAG